MKPKSPETDTTKPQPLPHEGGAWIRKDDGTLVREPEPETQPEPAPSTPVNPV